jgi:hypothetical protein
VKLREDRAILETIPRHAPNAVRVCVHIERIKISHKVISVESHSQSIVQN